MSSGRLFETLSKEFSDLFQKKLIKIVFLLNGNKNKDMMKASKQKKGKKLLNEFFLAKGVVLWWWW
jgi:hypothetical protein